MAYLDDLTEEERARQTEAQDIGGGAPVAAGGGATAGGPAPAAAPSSGFANLSQYFTANQDQARAQGAEMVGNLEQSAESALRSDDPGTAMGVLGELNAAGTPGGLATTLTTGEDPNYTAGQAGLDAYLGTRGADPGAFAGLRDLYGDRLPRVESAVAMPEVPEGYTYNPYDGDPLPPEYLAQMNEWNEWRQRRQENIDGTGAVPRNPALEQYYGDYFPVPYSNDDPRPKDEEEEG